MTRSDSCRPVPARALAAATRFVAAHRSRRLDDTALRLALTLWDAYLPALRIVELGPSLARTAADLTVAHTMAGADAVHLASALALDQADPALAVWDRRLHAGARAAGVRTVPASLAQGPR